MTPLDRFDAVLAEPVSTRSLGVVRMLVGSIAVVHLWPIVSDAVSGDTYHDRFHHPYVEALAGISPGWYTALLVVGLFAAIAMSIGAATRATTTTTFVVVAYHLALSTTHVHNNRAYLVTVLLVLAMSPCGRSFSVDSWLRARRRLDTGEIAPGWTLWLLRFVSAVTYGASGLSKLLDPDWFGGQVTWGRVFVQEAIVRDSLLPSAIADMLLDRSFHTIAAKAVVLTELTIAVGLWSRRTRRVAIAVAVVFHVMIEFSAEVQIFSYLGLAMLFSWADPELPWLHRGVDRSAAPSRPVVEIGA